MQFLNVIDNDFYNTLLDKYPNYYDECTNFQNNKFYDDLCNYILNNFNNSIPYDTFFDGILFLYVNFYGYSSLDAFIESMNETMDINSKYYNYFVNCNEIVYDDESAKTK